MCRSQPQTIPPACQVCGVYIYKAKCYCLKKRVCLKHLQAAAVRLPGQDGLQRWCFQCARFEPLAWFDGKHKNCRASLEHRRIKARGASCSAEQRASLGSNAGAHLLVPEATGVVQAAAQTCTAVFRRHWPSLQLQHLGTTSPVVGSGCIVPSAGCAPDAHHCACQQQGQQEAAGCRTAHTVSTGAGNAAAEQQAKQQQQQASDVFSSSSISSSSLQRAPSHMEPDLFDKYLEEVMQQELQKCLAEEVAAAVNKDTKQQQQPLSPSIPSSVQTLAWVDSPVPEAGMQWEDGSSPLQPVPHLAPAQSCTAASFQAHTVAATHPGGAAGEPVGQPVLQHSSGSQEMLLPQSASPLSSAMSAAAFDLKLAPAATADTQLTMRLPAQTLPGVAVAANADSFTGRRQSLLLEAGLLLQQELVLRQASLTGVSWEHLSQLPQSPAAAQPWSPRQRQASSSSLCSSALANNNIMLLSGIGNGFQPRF